MAPREIRADEVTQAVARMAKEANFFLPEDVLHAISQAAAAEESPLGKATLEKILDERRHCRQRTRAVMSGLRPGRGPRQAGTGRPCHGEAA